MRKRLLFSVTILALVGVFAAAMMGCATEGASTSSTESGDSSQQAEATGGTGGFNEDLVLPKVYTDENGDSFQRTPTDLYSDSNSSILVDPDKENNFNIRFLDGDNRGCYSCHDDLAQVIEDMDYGHLPLTNSYGIQPTVEMCKFCHSDYSGGYIVETDSNLGRLMHGIHADVESADCMSCHDATENGEGMTLWDLTRWEAFRGMRTAETVEGDFSFTQDTVGTRAEGTNFADYISTPWTGSMGYGYDWGNPEYAGDRQNEMPLDEQMFEEWAITITGDVEQEMTWTLPELIENAPVEELTTKMHCTWNPIGGPLISNAKVKGIPLSWLFEQAGASQDAYGFSTVPASRNENYDGKLAYYEFPVKMEGNPDDEAYIVFEIDGTKLTWSEGYPATLWVGGYCGASVATKQVTDIIVYNDEESFFFDSGHNWYPIFGWPATKDAKYAYADGGYEYQPGDLSNKTNAGFFNNREGRILTAGESYTFEGFADSFDREVATVEFSLDNGENWTVFETDGAVDDKWVHWSLTYTPEETGAFVIQVRATDVDGFITPLPQKLMFNVKAA